MKRKEKQQKPVPKQEESFDDEDVDFEDQDAEVGEEFDLEGDEEDFFGEGEEDGDQENGMDEEGFDEADGDEEGDEEDAMDEEDDEAPEGSIGEFYPDGQNDEANGEDDEETKKAKKSLADAKAGKGILKQSLEQKRRKAMSMKVNHIQCKERRLQLLEKRKHDIQVIENKRRREMRKQNKLEPEKAPKPITIEDARETDKTFVFKAEEELEADEELDEFASLFKQERQPKVLITTDENPSRHIFEFIKETKELIPNSYFYPRKKLPLKAICRLSTEKDFTHVMVVRERNKQPYQMVMICLPIGPSIVFRLSSIKLRKQLEFKGAPTGHKPELILKNFNTANGRRVGRFFGSMFDQDPEFKARTVVSFLNMRDYIFVRHHRYVFKENGTKCGLQEIGPRFTLKVKKIMEGTFEKFARVEWVARDDMYTSRKRVYM